MQAERDEWVSRNFPNDPPEEGLSFCIFGAVEEIGELAHHYLKMRQGIRGMATEAESKMYHETEMLDAVADTVIFLAGVCTHLGADYGALVQRTWDRVKERDWVNDPKEGVSA